MKTTIKAAAIILAAVMLCLGAASCARPGSGEDTTKEPSVTTERKGFEDVTDPPEESSGDTSAEEGSSSGQDSSAAFGREAAVEAARAWLGETDPDTGYKYAYSFDGMEDSDSGDCYRIRVSWYLEDEDRYSLCGYLLVSDGGAKIEKYDW